VESNKKEQRTSIIMISPFVSMCNSLGIGFMQKKVLKDNGIADYASLKTNRNDLERMELEIVTRKTLNSVVQFVEQRASTEGGDGDPLSTFDYNEYEDFVVMQGKLPTTFPADSAIHLVSTDNSSGDEDCEEVNMDFEIEEDEEEDGGINQRIRIGEKVRKGPSIDKDDNGDDGKEV
jgi:hypothetical protein